jgi:hypothetical protein
MSDLRARIQKIPINKANLEYIMETGVINGSLLLSIEKLFADSLAGITKNVLTEKESAVMEKTRELWDLILALPEEHPNDIQEYCRDVHNIQYRIFSRPIRRTF